MAWWVLLLRRGAFVIGGLLGTAACGGGTESGGPGSGRAVPLDQLAEPLATGLCEYLARCVPIAPDDQFPGGCYAYELPRIANDFIPQIQELVRTGRAAYDPERMRACLDSYRTIACGAAETELSDCRAALHGTVAIGGACHLQQECADNARCDTSSSCPGVCTARVAGASCDSSLDCANDLSCSPSRNVCVARARKGEACGGPDDILCVAPFACVGDTAAVLGKCQEYAHGDVGAACDWDEGNLCKPTLACVTTGKAADGTTLSKCVAKSASGGSCGVGLQDSCPTGEFCPLTATDRANGIFSSTCKPYGTPGAECSSPSSYACGTQGNCSSDGRCVALGKVGSVCKEDGDCFTNHCAAGTCAPDLGCE